MHKHARGTKGIATLLDKITGIDGTTIKRRRKIRRTMIPTSLHNNAIKQLHMNHMGIEKQEC